MMMPTTKRIAVTSGEPAGIGPDICLALAHHTYDAEIIVVGDPNVLQQRAQALGLDIKLKHYVPESQTPRAPGELMVLPMLARSPVTPGQLNPDNGAHVIAMLNRAIAGAQNKEFDAIVTAPVHKGIINDAGVSFSGHTEYLAEKTDTAEVVMLLVGGGMRVALVTRHIPLRAVSEAITPPQLEKTIRILHHDLKQKFGIDQPVIYVAGLNPHAGEGGHIGDEEIRIINPTLERLRLEGINLVGALSGDTLYSQKNIQQADAFLAMYHDQGLAVLKHASFGGGVNVTLGLPIIRTSVDHGTALDLAGTGKAHSGSLFSATELAIELAHRASPRK